MAEYTYDNIIVNPTKKGIESLIGKEVYFYDNPTLCLMNANEKSPVMSGILVKICKDSINPFRVERNGNTYEYPCIIEKKEDPKPKYVPFVNEKEFLGACYNNETKKLYGIYHYLATHGIWLKNRESDDLFMVVEIWDDGVVIGSNQFTTSWNDLRNEYTFLNGTPCGKEINDAED